MMYLKMTTSSPKRVSDDLMITPNRTSLDPLTKYEGEIKTRPPRGRLTKASEGSSSTSGELNPQPLPPGKSNPGLYDI